MNEIIVYQNTVVATTAVLAQSLGATEKRISDNFVANVESSP